MTEPIFLRSTETEQFGFSFVSGTQAPVQRLHRHDEIEVGVTEHGSVDSIIGRTRTLIPPGRLLVFWASQPHGPVAVDAGTHAHVVHVPLPYLTDAGIPPEFMRRLLEGEVIYAAPQSEAQVPDILLLKHWVMMLANHGAMGRQIVLHEVIARLLRMAAERASGDSEAGSSAGGALLVSHKQRHFLNIVRLLAERCAEPWTVERIAAEVGLNSGYAMRLFHEIGGISIIACLTQQRVALAQRLLLTTDAKILDIAFDSGFASVSSFYEMFARTCDQSPAKYRRLMRDAKASRLTKS
jgi:AraC-like DNA-binding protein